MKKNILCLFALVASLSLFTACSNDNKDNTLEQSGLVGTWKVTPVQMSADGQTLTYSPVTLEATAPGDTVNFAGSTVPVKMFATMMRGMLGGYASKLASITFQADGYVGATIYKQDDKDSVYAYTPKIGACKFRVENNQVFFIVDIASMMNKTQQIDAKTRATSTDLLTQISTTGIPVNYTVNGNKLNLYVTKDMITPYLNYITAMLPLMQSKMDAESYQMLTQYLAYFQKAFGMCTKFDLGIELSK